MKPSQKLAEFIVREEVKEWLDGNNTFSEDLQSLIHEMVMFELKYGIKILYSFNKQPNTNVDN